MADESTRRVRVVVSGRVQGVFYRANTAETARKLGLSGWVRNLPGGGVELVAEGPAGMVERLVSWCAKGPPAAVVTRVDVTDEEPTGDFAGFSVRYR